MAELGFANLGWAQPSQTQQFLGRAQPTPTPILRTLNSHSGWWGDAPESMCQECVCNMLGTDPDNFECDRFTGDCNCLPNVEGRECDRYDNFPNQKYMLVKSVLVASFSIVCGNTNAFLEVLEKKVTKATER